MVSVGSTDTYNLLYEKIIFVVVIHNLIHKSNIYYITKLETLSNMLVQ
jgi:hypothetical protein